MNRRQWAMAGVGASAAAAGLTWSLWRGAPAHADALWALRLPQPNGAELAMSSLQGKPLLVNFWATWCAPCVRELPAINRFYQLTAGKGWQVLGIAVDNLGPVTSFLNQVKLDFPVVLAGLDGLKLAQALGDPSGALPFSVLINARGEITHTKLGETNLDELLRWANAH